MHNSWECISSEKHGCMPMLYLPATDWLYAYNTITELHKFIDSVQELANTLLKERGRIILNDVYSLLGTKKTLFGTNGYWDIREIDTIEIGLMHENPIDITKDSVFTLVFNCFYSINAGSCIENVAYI